MWLPSFAAVAAEDGYVCDDEDDSWEFINLAGNDVTTHDLCKSACDSAIESGSTEDYDWCCMAIGEGEGTGCSLYYIDTAGLDIRTEAPDAEGVAFSAWAWGAGVPLADLTVVEETPADDDEEATEEDEEDMSVRMTASAVAAASIVMLAM